MRLPMVSRPITGADDGHRVGPKQEVQDVAILLYSCMLGFLEGEKGGSQGPDQLRLWRDEEVRCRWLPASSSATVGL